MSNRLVDRDGLSLFPGLRRESGGNVMQQQSSVRAGSLPRRLHIPSPHPAGVLFPGVADGSGGSASGFRHPLRTGPAGFGAWLQFVAHSLRLRAFLPFLCGLGPELRGALYSAAVPMLQSDKGKRGAILKAMQNWEDKKLLAEAMAQVEQGVFLMAEGNPMTISWCEFGRVWNRPVCTVLVRQSRHTHALLEQSGRFTVSIPKAGDRKEALAYCGTRSGREVNKLEALGLSLLPARAGGADGLAGCAMHFECRVVFKLESDLRNLDEAIRRQFYGDNQATPDGDPHTVYFGEILAAYRESADR